MALGGRAEPHTRNEVDRSQLVSEGSHYEWTPDIGIWRMDDGVIVGAVAFKQ